MQQHVNTDTTKRHIVNSRMCQFELKQNKQYGDNCRDCDRHQCSFVAMKESYVFLSDREFAIKERDLQ